MFTEEEYKEEQEAFRARVSEGPIYIDEEIRGLSTAEIKRKQAAYNAFVATEEGGAFINAIFESISRRHE